MLGNLIIISAIFLLSPIKIEQERPTFSESFIVPQLDGGGIIISNAYFQLFVS